MDDTGWAVFDYQRFLDLGATPQAALLALLESGTIHTSPKDDLAQRISDLAEALDTTAETYGCQWGVVEIPATSGDYSGKQRARQSLNLLYMSIGAALATLAATMPTTTSKASTTPKAQRHAALQLCHAATPKAQPLPVGPRGGKRDDEMDAICLGWWAMIGGDCNDRWKQTESKG
jgi:hypothetical protein